eukprot:1193132-Prorocentrum_minimum.AAC.1
MVSPSDGVVKSINQINSEYTHVAIYLNLLDTHVQWFPLLFTLSGLCRYSVGTLSGLCWDSVDTLSGLCWDSVGTLSGLCRESVGTDGNPVGNLSGICRESYRESVGNLIGNLWGLCGIR